MSRPCRILHFEDDEVDAEQIRRILKGPRDGFFELTRVGCMKTGRERLAEEHFDVVLLDLSLPDSFGEATYQAVRSLNESVPIVVMTGNEDRDLGAQLVQMGAQDYIVKSQINGDLLLRTLQYSIERQRIETELREAKTAALGSAKAKSEFLASMSHEIRTPLNSIIGMADLLSETRLDREQERYVDVFRNAGEVLLELINGILDLSKAETGALEIVNEVFDPRSFVENTLEVLAFSAHRKGLTLACDIAHDTPATVKGDEARLRQVLVNLVGNAVKFTDYGEVVVSLQPTDRTASEQPAGNLTFSVRDSGIGISPDEMRHIFEPFSQGDASITRRFGGTGLGLSLSVALVERMNGRIWAESVLGLGSEFFFTVDCEVVEAAHSPAPRDREEVQRILVGSSSATERRLLGDLLTHRGFEVFTVENGPDAVATLRGAEATSKLFSVVLIDCRMKNGGSFEIADQLEAGSPHRERTIAMLTADHRIGDIAECDRLGLGGWLVKPWKSEILVDQIEEISSGCRIHRVGVVEPAQDGDGAVDLVDKELRILLADDSEDNRALIRAYLSKTAWHLDEAENGVEAVELFKKNVYDVVLMDMQMPVMDGYTATRGIRGWERSRGLDSTPVLALTAHAFAEEERKTRDAGCDQHLTKPIRKKFLLEAIAKQLSYPAAWKVASERSTDTTKETEVSEEGAGKEPIMIHIEEDIRELIDGFLENRHGDVGKIDTAIAAGELDKVRVLGHNMKGVGRSYGFEGISEIGVLLEQAGKKGEENEARKHLHALADYLDRVQLA